MDNTNTIDNNLHRMLFERHSIRKYKDTPLNPDHVKEIIEAGLLAPSSKSARPWQFIVVEDPEMLNRMSACKTVGAKPLANAKLAIVIAADPTKSDVFIEDCSVAASFMHLQATALGIGSCWIQIRNRFNSEDEPAENIIRELLDIPNTLEVVVILTLGISDEQRKPVDPDKLLWEKVHIGTWRNLE